MKGRKPVRFEKPLEHEVGGLVRVGLKWSFVRLAARQVIGIATTAVLARLLSPSDFGLTAMVTVIMSFLTLLDTGLTWATVQSSEIDQEAIDTIFWMGAILGLLLWGVLVALGPFLARFYGQPQLFQVCIVLGAGLLANSLSGQMSAVTKRQINQALISSIETYSMIAGNLTAIVCALFRLGYWALVIQVVAGYVYRLIAYFLFSDFRPGKPKFTSKGFQLAKQGILFGACNWLNYSQLYLDSILVGRNFGTEILGYYNRAFFLRSLSTAFSTLAVNDVVIPAMSALTENRRRMGDAYRRALAATAFFSFPVGIVFAVSAREVVYILYGSNWLQVIPLLRLFALPAIMLPLMNTTTWLFISNGKGKQQLAASAIILPFAVVGFVVAALMSVQAIAFVSMLVLSVISPGITFYSSHRSSDLRLRDSLMSVMPIALSGAAAALGMYLAGWLSAAAGLPFLVTFGAKLFVGALIYLLGCKLFVHPFPFRLPLNRR